MEKQYLDEERAHFVNFPEELSELCSQNYKKKKTWGKLSLKFDTDSCERNHPVFLWQTDKGEKFKWKFSNHHESWLLFGELDQPLSEGLRFLSRPQRNWSTVMQVEKP